MAARARSKELIRWILKTECEGLYRKERTFGWCRGNVQDQFNLDPLADHPHPHHTNSSLLGLLSQPSNQSTCEATSLTS